MILQKYIRRLFIAYLFWCVFYSLFRACFDAVVTGSFTFHGVYLLPHFHLWFLPMLMGVYFLIPLLRKVSADYRLSKYAIILWICFTSISFVFLFFPSIPQISELFVVNIVFGYAGYFVLGYVLTSYSFDKYKRIVNLLGGIGFIFAISGLLFSGLKLGEANLSFVDNLTPQVILMASAVFICLKDKAGKIGRRLNTVIEFVRKDLFGIYLTHCIWVMFIDLPWVRKTFFISYCVPIVAVVIFILSLFTSKLCRRIPFLREVIE